MKESPGRAELAQRVAELETAFRGQQAELEATSNELERIRNRATELERDLAAATARNEWYIRTQNLAMDLE